MGAGEGSGRAGVPVAGTVVGLEIRRSPESARSSIVEGCGPSHVPARSKNSNIITWMTVLKEEFEVSNPEPPAH